MCGAKMDSSNEGGQGPSTAAPRGPNHLKLSIFSALIPFGPKPFSEQSFPFPVPDPFWWTAGWRDFGSKIGLFKMDELAIGSVILSYLHKRKFIFENGNIL